MMGDPGGGFVFRFQTPLGVALVIASALGSVGSSDLVGVLRSGWLGSGVFRASGPASGRMERGMPVQVREFHKSSVG